jgi:hypothetical protein
LIGEFQLCYLAYFDSITVKDITELATIVQQSDDSKDHFSEEMELSIAMVSWSIYGIAFKWSTTGSFSQKELAAKSASLIQNGTNELLFTRSVMG